MRDLILASASPRRRQLLAQAGLVFSVMPGTMEERQRGNSPGEVAEYLAAGKAEEIAGKADRSAVVLGADTLVVCDGEILGKPKDEEDAFRMLRKLQGRTHCVYTGVAVVCRETELRRVFHEETQVTVAPMEDWEIRGYIATGEPMDKAGAYGIQGRFGVYIEKIAGDYFNVVGLPIARVYREMKALGLIEKERRE